MNKAITSENVEQRLLSKRKIDKSTGCWLYTGALSRGYGAIQFNYKSEKVHRLSAMLYLKYDLNHPYLIVLHKNICPNKHCFNPEHIYIGSHGENVSDSIIAGTHRSLVEQNKIMCSKGHLYTQENTHISKKGKRVCKKCGGWA